jgi:hypothetical protein
MAEQVLLWQKSRLGKAGRQAGRRLQLRSLVCMQLRSCLGTDVCRVTIRPQTHPPCAPNTHCPCDRLHFQPPTSLAQTPIRSAAGEPASQPTLLLIPSTVRPSNVLWEACGDPCCRSPSFPLKSPPFWCHVG